MSTIRDLIREYCLATVQASPEEIDRSLNSISLESELAGKPNKLEECHKLVREEAHVAESVGIATSLYHSLLCNLLRSGRIRLDFVDQRKLDKFKHDMNDNEKAIKWLAWSIMKLYGDWSKKEPTMPP
jgi:hypothetical protein